MTQPNDTPWWDPDARPAPETAPPADDTGGSAPQRQTIPTLILAWIKRNRHTTLYMLIGLALAIGILGIGFWRTVLIALCVAAGYTIGSWRDGNPRLLARIQRFYERWINDNPFMK